MIDIIPSVILFDTDIEDLVKIISNVEESKLKLGIILSNKKQSKDTIDFLKSKKNVVLGCFYQSEKKSNSRFDFIVIPFQEVKSVSLRRKDFFRNDIVISFFIGGKFWSLDLMIEQLREYFIFSMKYPFLKYAVLLDENFKGNIVQLAKVLNKLGIKNIILKGAFHLLFKELKQISSLLSNKKKEPFKYEYEKQIKKFREKTDKLDLLLLKTLSERKKIINQMKEIKKLYRTPYFDPQRFAQIISERKQKAKDFMLDEMFIEKIFEFIHFDTLKTMLKK